MNRTNARPLGIQIVALVMMNVAGLPLFYPLETTVRGNREGAALLDSPPGDAEILEFLAADKWPESLESHDTLLAEVFRAGPLNDVTRYGAALQNLAAIVEYDPEAASGDQEMRTAVAVALEFAGPYINKGAKESCARYQWYRDARIARRLDRSFDLLQSWERRFVVNIPWHHGSGSNESLDWLNTNVKLPAGQYQDACWQVPYSGHNPFGETVQGPLYYVPFEEFLAPYEMRRAVGAVCGGLSHFGAAAARANGIGATTMGEPGHCAYAIRIDGKWIPCYSLSYDRHAHQSILHAEWPYVELQDQAFRDPEKNLAAARLAGWAMMASKTDPRHASKIAVQACDIQPLNPFLWELRFRLLQEAGLKNPSAWWDQARQLGRAMRGFPQVVVKTLMVLDQKLPAFVDPSQRGRIMAAALQEAMGDKAEASPATSWKTTFDQAYAFSGKELRDQSKLCLAIASAIAQGPDAASFMEDALGRFSGEQEIIDMLVSMTLEGVRKNRVASSESKARLAETGIIAAAARRDPEAFGKFASIHPSPVSAELAPPSDPFPGRMVSQGGSIRFSSTSYWDSIAGHAGILTTGGGRFHTSNGDVEWAEVTLPRIAKLSGIVIDNVQGHSGRAVPLSVEVSLDGEKWEKVFETDIDQPQWRVDLREATPTARFIRVNGSIARRDFLHLRRILVYGRPQS